jgi:hypothetical protein
MSFNSDQSEKNLFDKVITVKPVLTATFEQRPPANNGQPKPGQNKFNSNFD